MCGAKERTNVGAELRTDDLVGADFGEVSHTTDELVSAEKQTETAVASS